MLVFGRKQSQAVALFHRANSKLIGFVVFGASGKQRMVFPQDIGILRLECTQYAGMTDQELMKVPPGEIVVSIRKTNESRT